MYRVNGSRRLISFVPMKRSAIVTFCLLMLVVFTRCSWIEQFVIYNKSDKAIYVTYEIEQGGTFPIFSERPSVHQLAKTGAIDWASEMYVNDEDALRTKIRIALPPNSALIFGGLHNDKYKSYDQKFINNRTFNLISLQILASGKTLDVVPSTFDSYFKKHQGQIRLMVKEPKSL